MIGRILVALDTDADTPVATQYAIRLAERTNAYLTGLAVIDMENIYSSIGTGGVGTIYYADKLREVLAEENRVEARKLLEAFHHSAEEAGVEYNEELEEGVPHERIIEEMKYHDLLIIGRDSHFFYTRPEKETRTLQKVIKKSIAPTLVVTDRYRKVEQVLVALDESMASARTLQSFMHLLPFGRNVDIELVHVLKDDSKKGREQAHLLLRLAEKFVKGHGCEYTQKTLVEKGNPAEGLLNRIEISDPDIVLLGAHSMSAIKRLTLGSTTYELITKSKIPLYVNN